MAFRSLPDSCEYQWGWWDARFEEQVRHKWNSNTQNVLVKLKELGLRLNCWAQKEKRLKVRRTKELNAKLFELGNREICETALEKMTEIKLQLNLEADKEELFWEQKARINWLWMGDRNTTFFHRSATARKKKNMVKGLENDVGNLVTDFDGMSKIAADYFK
ncbi:reverse transcriptase [Gossypium australe]|uniref:Reverse transcriptase n=1 Tax=Gossypium australe TaxID=47621 RepID=A0A5B6UPC0_9ROSI|nr:reverse transcriptase [Gossypium australe]